MDRMDIYWVPAMCWALLQAWDREGKREAHTHTEMMMWQGVWEPNLMGPFEVRLQWQGDASHGGNQSQWALQAKKKQEESYEASATLAHLERES